ncbi:MAG TPA: hypothetical protein VK752_27130, partial [Bryobacteraceae bacterium]|nr:hypothetical protein [Bryobacteraceae bacterium]
LGVDREFISRRDAEGAENANAFRAKALSSARNQLTWALALEAWCGPGIHFTQRRRGRRERECISGKGAELGKESVDVGAGA